MIRRFALASAILIAAGSAAPAMAGSSSSNINIGANVVATCTISAVSFGLGIYDPFATSDLVATTSLTTNCTNGASAVITLGQGANPAEGSTDAAPLRRLNGGSSSNMLTYQIFKATTPSTEIWGNTTATGVSVTGTGASVTTTIYATVTAGQQNVAPGGFTDNVTATISY
ncbi:MULTISPECIES: spore coat U domain-containing protein [Cyanophyceae]|uniref:Csu type fimbrial protein n=1 Tax=Cyanophyceae TaxID=3028117 RepID=UPI00232B9A81|nr:MULTISPECIES: spore coat protein U domain-containing protein [Cyanophyceae]MDB9356163.1 spore coat protein U domain-containing protein [Nodularia spumigena CS-587/03]MDB9339168.1 spore coat protein U domain-containing protein [Nodularia spumigena CS-589/07]MDB9399936.1 spore coat protein U domain-containing protein [Microcystis aeruginosa CS-567/02-A1]MDB9499808.1 spore coat protein U domain-containing protein [Nodularia spumigena CS-336/02]MDB9530395.1 spore coat protein U domain-containin